MARNLNAFLEQRNPHDFETERIFQVAELKVTKKLHISPLLQNAEGTPIVPPTLTYNWSCSNPSVLQMVADPQNDLAVICTGLAVGTAQVIFTCTAEGSQSFTKTVDVNVVPNFPSQVLANVTLNVTYL